MCLVAEPVSAGGRIHMGAVYGLSNKIARGGQAPRNYISRNKIAVFRSPNAAV